ncbi:MAG: glycerate kinase [Anaerolineae bacterium]|nr:glycerate kinase [Anaerolineae bacterium]
MSIKFDLPIGYDLPAGIHSIIECALGYSDPHNCMERHIKSASSGFYIDDTLISTTGRTILVSVGKAAYPMAVSFIQTSQVSIDDGIIITKHLPVDTELPAQLKVRLGDHPVPGMNSITSTRELINLLDGLTCDDTVISLISGGGSALMTAPRKGVALEDIQGVTKKLLACGAKIDEINCIRKHLDQIKGGGLLQFAQPAKVVSIILSDVVGSPLDVIASGPTTADASTFAQAQSILEKYKLDQAIPEAVKSLITLGVRDEIPETLKPAQAAQMDHQTVVIGSNYLTAFAVVEKAKEAGFHAAMMTSYLQGEAREAGKYLASVAREICVSGNPMPAPTCLVFGGETTVTIQGDGLGGRNLEVALGAVLDAAGLDNMAIVTLATDGEDGPTDATGAIVTGETYRQGRRSAGAPASYLLKNDSYRYFEQVGGLIKTGPTGTNVNDLAMILCW